MIQTTTAAAESCEGKLQEFWCRSYSKQHGINTAATQQQHSSNSSCKKNYKNIKSRNSHTTILRMIPVTISPSTITADVVVAVVIVFAVAQALFKYNRKNFMFDRQLKQAFVSLFRRPSLDVGLAIVFIGCCCCCCY